MQIGDTVHIADPAVPDIAPPNISVIAQTIAELLATSRAAHARFQHAAGHNDGRGVIRHPDDDAAALAIREALTNREAAEAADPGHADPAWADDQAANKGVSSDTLLFFFRDYFASDVKL